jgi:hypothetical protein
MLRRVRAPAMLFAFDGEVYECDRAECVTALAQFSAITAGRAPELKSTQAIVFDGQYIGEHINAKRDWFVTELVRDSAEGKWRASSTHEWRHTLDVLRRHEDADLVVAAAHEEPVEDLARKCEDTRVATARLRQRQAMHERDALDAVKAPWEATVPAPKVGDEIDVVVTSRNSYGFAAEAVGAVEAEVLVPVQDWAAKVGDTVRVRLSSVWGPMSGRYSHTAFPCEGAVDAPTSKRHRSEDPLCDEWRVLDARGRQARFEAWVSAGNAAEGAEAEALQMWAWNTDDPAASERYMAWLCDTREGREALHRRVTGAADALAAARFGEWIATPEGKAARATHTQRGGEVLYQLWNAMDRRRTS